jgi:peptide/nickel transport system permease protein
MTAKQSQLLGFLKDVGRSLCIALGIVIATFFLIRVIPGDVVDVMAIQGDLTYQQQTVLREEIGLDKSWSEQFILWSKMIIRGDFGVSSRFNVPIVDLIATALPVTVKLAFYGIGIGLILGVGLSILAIRFPGGIFKHLVDFITIWSITIPTFSIGITAVVVFAVWLGWIPAVGNLFVPAVILGMDIAGTLAKMLHEDLKEIGDADFVRTAKAKGLSSTKITLMHILPNGVATTLALVGIIFAGALSGTITLEVVFGLPGIGTLSLGAMKGRDYPLVQAVVIWLGLAVIMANLITDALHRLIDPRIK